MHRSDKYQDLLQNLKCGNVCVFETDTVVGVACIVDNMDSIDRIYKIKHRDYDKALPWLIASKDMMMKYVDKISGAAEEQLKNSWPGANTFIFKVNDIVNNQLGSYTADGAHTVAFRVPNCSELITLINELGCPLVCTSANISNKSPVCKVADLDNELIDNVDYIYDKPLHSNTYTKASKVISFVGEDAKVLRN